MGGWGGWVLGGVCADGGGGGGGGGRGRFKKVYPQNPPCLDFFWNSPFHNSPPTL